jgi:hypothetical protein
MLTMSLDSKVAREQHVMFPVFPTQLEAWFLLFWVTCYLILLVPRSLCSLRSMYQFVYTAYELEAMDCCHIGFAGPLFSCQMDQVDILLLNDFDLPWYLDSKVHRPTSSQAFTEISKSRFFKLIDFDSIEEPSNLG